ncbi:MAG: hypothetical protein RMM28_07525 [Thermoleophilia bacterium]|nr:hypothetical protein [Thermoleophilia bacterium]
MIVEYAVIVAAVSLLAVTLAGGFSAKLATVPVTHAVALEQVAAAATAKRLSAREAKAVYRQAPYRTPSLKYLFAIGWVGGASNVSACGFTLLAEDSARARAVKEIRRDPTIVAALKRRGLSAPAAARALVAGVVSACR